MNIDPRVTGAVNPPGARPELPPPPEPGPEMTGPGEPEDATKEFSTESGSFAIVDAALLKGMEDNPLVQKAVVFPTKGNVAFEISAEYDDTVLRGLSMSPKASETEAGRIEEPGHEEHEATPEVVPPDMASPAAPVVAQTPVVPEGIAPLSHDSSPERAMRKHKTPRSRRHMDGSDRYRKVSPARKVLSRLKRPSRHQPDVEEAFDFITKMGGKEVTEEAVNAVNNKSLLFDSLGLLMAMTMNGWEVVDESVTNGTYEVVDDRFTIDKTGHLLMNGKRLPLDFNWLYDARMTLQKNITESALKLGRTING